MSGAPGGQAHEAQEPKLDESVERDKPTLGEFKDAMRAVMARGPPKSRIEDREPTRAVLRERWQMRRRG